MITVEQKYVELEIEDRHREKLNSLLEKLKKHHIPTYEHSIRVGLKASEIAEFMHLDPKSAFYGVLHDIGKIGIPENILNKPGKLTVEEWQEIKTHPLIGETILKSLDLLKPGLSLVRHHHERYDGKGYPDGLKEAAIPKIAAIVTVADAYDAMTSPRPYRPAMPKEKAIEELKQNSSTQFDPEIVNALVKVIG